MERETTEMVREIRVSVRKRMRQSVRVRVLVVGLWGVKKMTRKDSERKRIKTAKRGESFLLCNQLDFLSAFSSINSIFFFCFLDNQVLKL